MSFIKNLWTDLVDKRLWPVALVLLVVLVAVPVALGGASDDAPVSAPAGATGVTGAASAIAQPAQIALDPGFPVRRDRGEEVRDPFKQREVPGGTTGTTGAAGAPSQAPSPAPATGGAGGGAGAPPTSPTSPTTPTTPTTPDAPQPRPPAPDPLDSYLVAVRFGKVGAKRARRTVERLTPMPSSSPFFVYLGALDDKKTAVFLLSSDVKAAGEGVCRPRKSSCQTLELRRGESELLEVTAEDGTVTRYLLDLLKVTRKQVAAPSRPKPAAKAIAKLAPETATKASAEDAFVADRYAYDGATGLLRRVKESARVGAHLPADGENARRTVSEGWILTEKAVAAAEFVADP